MTLEDQAQDARDFIDDKITELEPELQSKKAEAIEKDWSEAGRKYQAVNELANHIISLKRIKSILS